MVLKMQDAEEEIRSSKRQIINRSTKLIMSIFNIKSHAKINLALNIIGKSKRLHKIESIVAFLDLYDEIEIKKVDYKDHKIKFLGKFSSGKILVKKHRLTII